MKRRALLTVPIASLLLVAACGSDNNSSSDTTSAPAGSEAATTAGGAATTGAATAAADHSDRRRQRGRLAEGRLPRHRRVPDRLEPGGRARPAVQHGRRRLHRRLGQAPRHRPARVEGRGHRREDRGPLRRTRHRLPDGDLAALRRPVHHARLRLDRRGPPELRRLPDQGRRGAVQHQPADHHVGPGHLPAGEGHQGPQAAGREGPLLRRRRLHGLPHPERSAGQEPDRRLLRRHAGQLRGRRRQGRPAGLRLRPSRTSTRRC